MALPFPSDEWIKELSRQLNESPSYEAAAKDWEGDFIFVVEPDEVYPDTVYLYLALHHGKSPDGALLAGETEREAPFTLRAPFSTWRKVIEGKLDPIQAIMSRRLKLTGNLLKVVRYPKAAQEIINCCTRIETEFPAR